MPEGAATEIDVSAARCEIVHSVAVKNSADADHEECPGHPQEHELSNPKRIFVLVC